VAKRSSIDSKYTFDKDSADKGIEFFEEYLVHIKGEWAGQKLELWSWQDKFIRELFGWKREDGTRKYRQAYIEVPRKNGKSTLCAGIALYLLFADGEAGAEVYSAAADREQAHIVFDVARQMVLRNEYLSSKASCYQTSVSVASTASRYKSLSADADTKLGFNSHGVIFDEIAVQKHSKLYDALKTSTHASRQPLMIMITTAGIADKNSIGWEMADYARKVKDGVIKDESFLSVIYSADKEEDWTDEKVWKKVNPSYGICVKPEALKEECDRAKQSPAAQNSFRRFYLDQWVEQAERFIDMGVWDANADAVDPLELQHAPCFAGLDLSSTIDVSAFVLLFPPENEGELWEVLPYFWIPAENVQKRVERDRVPYDSWIRDGWIEATEGNVVDQSVIRRRIAEIADEFEIMEVPVDPWNSQQLQTQLMGDGFNVVPFRQGFYSMNAPTKELMALLMSGQIRVGENPVLRWMAANMAVAMDAAGNYKPAKDKATDRIDGIVALIMALGRAMQNEDEGNVYEDRAEAGEELLTWA